MKRVDFFLLDKSYQRLQRHRKSPFHEFVDILEN